MYQRYYKQRKFGKVFGFVLIVGSGLSHYVRNGMAIFKNLTSLKNIERYEEHLPPSISRTIHYANKSFGGLNESIYSKINGIESKEEIRQKILMLELNNDLSIYTFKDKIDKEKEKTIIGTVNGKEKYFKSIYNGISDEERDSTLRNIRIYKLIDSLK